MLKKDVVVGKLYAVKVSGKIAPVRLNRESPFGGWDGTNTVTGREIRIRSAAKLRHQVAPQVSEAQASLLRTIDPSEPRCVRCRIPLGRNPDFLPADRMCPACRPALDDAGRCAKGHADRRREGLQMAFNAITSLDNEEKALMDKLVRLGDDEEARTMMINAFIKEYEDRLATSIRSSEAAKPAVTS